MERGIALLAVLVLSSLPITYTSGQSSTRVSSDNASRVLPARPPSVRLPLSTEQVVPAIELLAWYTRTDRFRGTLRRTPFCAYARSARRSGSLAAEIGGFVGRSGSGVDRHLRIRAEWASARYLSVVYIGHDDGLRRIPPLDPLLQRAEHID
jgi:hypothetical protein